MLKDEQDAFGHEFYDFLKGTGGYEIAERDDGFFEVTQGPKIYFSKYEEWPNSEKEAMKYVSGRVLDIGCGAGRHSLYLQEQGFDVIGVDNSPLVVDVCRQRGLWNVYLAPITQITSRLGVFDTILMLGCNFGLFGTAGRAKRLLRRFAGITSGAARIIAQTRDPYQTQVREHLEYHEFNRKRGRMAGEVRIRVRYKKYVTPWFDLLLVSKGEMKAIVEGTPWEIRDFIDDQRGVYVAILGKKSR